MTIENCHLNGIRLDAYVNNENGTVFNIEMQTTKDMDELVKRARYYQAMIDIDLLAKGQDYEALNNTFIIFICTFSVFTGNLHKYTFKNLCLEEQGLNLDDGTTKLFLSTKGQVDDISKPLKNFLDYVDGHAPADDLMREIDNEVDVAKNREEWRREYMTLALEIEKEKKQSWENGRFELLKELVNEGVLTIKEAAAKFGVSEELFKQRMML